MFEKDEPGNRLVLPTAPGPGVQVLVEQPEVGEDPSSVTPEPAEDVADSEPKNFKVQTLRDMLYAEEPWQQAVGDPGRLSPGIRRLQEKRVNRTLKIVADWMLGLVENHVGDEMALVVLLEQAEEIRNQIVWPERDSTSGRGAQKPSDPQ